MKWLAIIFSFYLLSLPLMPCADVEEVCCEKDCTESSASSHSEESDDCTPFCCCACCPATVFVKTKQPDWAIKESNGISHASFYHYYCSYISHTIWQPPRVG